MNTFNKAIIMKDNEHAYTDKVMGIIKNFPQLKAQFPILEQISRVPSKTGDNMLTLNDRKIISGSEAQIYVQNIKQLADPNIKKVEDPISNKVISDVFGLFPQMMVYQHGVGKSKYGFNSALPVDKYNTIMKYASKVFSDSYMNEKTFNVIFDRLTQVKTPFKSYMIDAVKFEEFVPAKPVEVTEEELLESDPEEEQAPTPGTQLSLFGEEPTQPTETSKTFVPELNKINQVKPESISNVKEMSFNELGTFTFTVGESEYQVSPKKNNAGDIKFNIYKYDDNTKLYNLVSNPKTRRSLSTKEASDFLSKNLPEDFIKFVINLYNNRKVVNLNLPSKGGATKLNPNPIATQASSLMNSYLYQKPMREQTYDGSDFPILLTLEEVNKKFEEYYSDELRSGIKKYLEPFAKDQLIKSIEAEEEKLNIFNERGSTKSAKISKMFIEDLKNALKNFVSTQPTAEPTNLPGLETKINIYAGTGENAELSNFAVRPFIVENADTKLGGLRFNTVEGAFQAAKLRYTSLNLNERIPILDALKNATGAEAKKIGRQITGLDTKAWDENSSRIMKDLIKESFEQNPNALAKLLATGNATLTHTQDTGKWGTEFPKLLMEVRDELRATQPTEAPVSTDKFGKKNLFTVTPIQAADKKAVIKASIATQFIGFGEGITGSSTETYRQQAGALANTGNYSADDVIFVSIGGKRGTEVQQKTQQDRTIKEAIKAVEAGATILTDNKAYTDASNYNTGEKRLYANMEAKGYNYSEITVDGQVIGTWSKGIVQPQEDLTNFTERKDTEEDDSDDLDNNCTNPFLGE